MCSISSTVTDDDVPVHSFRTLFTDLGTLAANTMQVAGGDAACTRQIQPTRLQQRCLAGRLLRLLAAVFR